MEKENCMDCLFANISNVSIIMEDLINDSCRVCEHPNSPFFEKYVNETKVCRLYVDEVDYFKNRDREEKIDKIRNRNKFNNF